MYDFKWESDSLWDIAKSTLYKAAPMVFEFLLPVPTKFKIAWRLFRTGSILGALGLTELASHFIAAIRKAKEAGQILGYILAM